ncbi:MAG: MBL fold metallo-hydrolase [Prevotella sp.]|nr:MBL fold metallo-hydrolase [Prevotella sp.]
MIDIRSLQCNPVQENCFIASDDTHEAVVIDCGAYFNEERTAVVEYLRSNDLKLRHVLCTHAHFDHIFGVDTLYDTFGVKPRLHAADDSIYDSMDEQTRAFLGCGFNRTMPPLGDSLKDGDRIGFGHHQIQVFHTPGHSPGSVLLYIEEEKVVFAGDTLFRMGVGRTDLEGGSWQQLMDSLQHVVAKLPADVKVLPGHGPSTTIGEELRMNPYLRY